MEREALKLALKSLQTLVESHGHTNYISEEEKELEAEVVFARQAINAVRAALYAPSQEPDALTIAYQSGYYDGKKAALAGREWNFCERCGKRTKDIHTCTPPNAQE